MALLRPLRPVPKKYRITLHWGAKREHYSLGYHTGTDFAAPFGTRVRAPRAGRVTNVAYSRLDYGNYVEMKDWAGRKVFLVAHLSRPAVKVGQYVARGQTLGYSGNSGNSSGPHLHAEQRHKPFNFVNTEKPGWE